jgi:hypothetical protein
MKISIPSCHPGGVAQQGERGGWARRGGKILRHVARLLRNIGCAAIVPQESVDILTRAPHLIEVWRRHDNLKQYHPISPELARHELSAHVGPGQAVGAHPNTVRRYVDRGIPPPVERSPSGYRRFTQRHSTVCA